MENGSLAFNDSAKKKEVWKYYYERLLNVENVWDKESLQNVNLIEEMSIWINSGLAGKAIKDMKTEKSPGPSWTTTEMLKTSGRVGYDHSYSGCPQGSHTQLLVLQHFGPGDESHTKKNIAQLIRKGVNINEIQFGFVPSRIMTDAIFLVKQL